MFTPVINKCLLLGIIASQIKRLAYAFQKTASQDRITPDIRQITDDCLKRLDVFHTKPNFWLVGALMAVPILYLFKSLSLECIKYC